MTLLRTIRESTTTVELYKIWWYHVVPYFQTNQYVLYIYNIYIYVYICDMICVPVSSLEDNFDGAWFRGFSKTIKKISGPMGCPTTAADAWRLPRNWLSMKQGFSTLKLKPCRWMSPLLAAYYSTMNLNIKLFQIKFAGLLSSVVRIKTICMQEFLLGLKNHTPFGPACCCGPHIYRYCCQCSWFLSHLSLLTIVLGRGYVNAN